MNARVLRSLSVYARIARVTAEAKRRSWAALLVRSAFLGMVLFVFSRVWGALLAQGPGASASVGVREHVWYLAVTEWIVLSQPRLYLELEREVRSGSIVYHLLRPTAYLGFKLSEALGELVLSLFVVGLAGACFGYVVAGGAPADPRGLLLAIPLGLLASVLALLGYALIGVSAVWLVDCTPVYWIWQKATFVLGGLMVPLALYPDWLAAIARATPFAALLAGPASMVFAFDPAQAGAVALALCKWIAVFAMALHVLARRALRVLAVGGG